MLPKTKRADADKIVKQIEDDFFGVVNCRIMHEYMSFGTESVQSIRYTRPARTNPTFHTFVLCRRVMKRIHRERERNGAAHALAFSPATDKCKYHQIVKRIADDLALRPEDVLAQIRSLAAKPGILFGINFNDRHYQKQDSHQCVQERNWYGLAARLSYDLAAIESLIRLEERRRDSDVSTFACQTTSRPGYWSNDLPNEILRTGDTSPPTWYTETGRKVSGASVSPPVSLTSRNSWIAQSIVDPVKAYRRRLTNPKMPYLQSLQALLFEVRDKYFDDITTYSYEGKYQLTYRVGGKSRQEDNPKPDVVTWKRVEYQQPERLTIEQEMGKKVELPEGYNLKRALAANGRWDLQKGGDPSIQKPVKELFSAAPYDKDDGHPSAIWYEMTL